MSGMLFISYCREDPQPTRDLAAYLESEGYSVWWDTDLLSGQRFRDVIDRQLDVADAVIVIWTPHSIYSDWVISEADHANRDGKLIPLRTRDLDIWRIPKPYSTYQIDLIDDRAAVLAAVSRVVGILAYRAAKETDGKDFSPQQPHYDNVTRQTMPSIVEPPLESSPLLAGTLLVFSVVGEVFKQIAARWRGIILLNIFFFTIWIAIQVFQFARHTFF
jgi:hypothetical protein